MLDKNNKNSQNLMNNTRLQFCLFLNDVICYGIEASIFDENDHPWKVNFEGNKDAHLHNKHRLLGEIPQFWFLY